MNLENLNILNLEYENQCDESIKYHKYPSTLTSFNIENKNNFTKLPRISAINVCSLNLSNNSIDFSNVTFEFLEKIKILILKNMGLKFLPKMPLNLDSLLINNNPISTIDNIPENILDLNINNTKIENIDKLEKFKKLSNISAENTQIREINKLPDNLHSLYISYNEKLEKINIDKFNDEFNYLQCSYCSLLRKLPDMSPCNKNNDSDDELYLNMYGLNLHYLPRLPKNVELNCNIKVNTIIPSQFNLIEDLKMNIEVSDYNKIITNYDEYQNLCWEIISGKYIDFISNDIKYNYRD